MGRRSADDRESLFRVLASNLTCFFPELKDTVVCPLCHSTHGTGSLAGVEPRLTLEHCIPRSLGGNALTLTCRACNNCHGASFDSHLKNMLVAEDAIEGIGGSVDGIMSIEGHPYRCTVGFSPDGQKSIHFQPIMKASNPSERDAAFAIIEACSRSGDDFKGQFTLRFGYAQLRWRIALVKSAYLLMFRQFGYSYMFVDGPEFVRRLLLDPDYDILAAACALTPQAAEIPLVNRALIVKAPDDLRCFLVPVRVRTDYRTRIKFVILPGFDDNPSGIYDRWHQRGEHGRISDVKFTCVDAGPDSLFDPIRFGALALWDRTFGLPPRRIQFKSVAKTET
jgi:hypothetical protein